MTIEKHVIDTEKIAVGMLEIARELEDDYQVAMRFGMLPAPLMDILSRALGKYSLSKNGHKEAMHEISLAMLKRIDLVV